MRLLGLFLLLLVCEFVAPTPVSDDKGGDDAGFRRVYRSTGIRETIRNWYQVVKDRIIGKWHEWFGEDSSTLNFSAQDILNIDKTIESRVSGYPGLFVDLSDVAFDPQQDWGVRVGNWYVIRKITGDNYNPDNDEWDIKTLIPRIPFSPKKIDWLPGVVFDESEVPTQSPTTTSMTTRETTTTERQIPRTESVLPSTESAVVPEPTVTFTEQIPSTTQLITSSSSELSRGTITSTEAFVTEAEPVIVPIESTSATESIVTATESAVATVNSIPSESTAIPNESIIPSTEATPISTVSNATSNVVTTESTVISTETIMESTSMSTEETTVIPTTEATSTTFILPVLNKRVEENETIDRQSRKKARPSSAEVIMF